MKKWQSFSALKRVKQEIETLAGEVAGALDIVFSTPSDEIRDISVLRGPAVAFARVPGVLQLLAYPHLALLAGEIHRLLMSTLRSAQELDEREIEARLELAFVAVTDLPALFEDALRESRDNFDKIYQTLNRLRKFRHCAVIFDGAALLQKPQVDFRGQFGDRPDKMRELMSRQVTGYRKCCQLLVREPGNDKALATLKQVVGNLQVILRDFRIGGLLGLAAGLVDILEAQSDDRDAVIALLARLEPVLVKAAAGDTAALDATIDETTLEDILNHIASAGAHSPRLGIIRQWYNLDSAATRQFRRDYRDLQVSYFNKTALHNSLGLINEDIMGYVDRIEVLAQETDLDREKIDEILSGVAQLTDVLGFLRMHYLVDLIDRALAENGDQTAAQALSMVAGVLFSISKALNDKRESMEGEIVSTAAGMTAANTLGSAKLHILNAAMQALEAIITDINAFVENDCRGRELAAIETGLAQLLGVFTMVQLPEQMGQVAVARQYVASLAARPSLPLPDEVFQAFSHLVINWLWYLEQLTLGIDNDARTYLEKGEAYAALLAGFLADHPPLAAQDDLADSDGVAAGTPQDDADLASDDEPRETPVGFAAGNDADGADTTADPDASERPEPVMTWQPAASLAQEPAAGMDPVPGTDVVVHADNVPTLHATVALADDNGQDAAVVANVGQAGQDDDEDEDDDIRAIFAEEFDEVLGMLNEEVANLAGDPDQPGLVKDCCRYFHTLKGSGKMVEATDIATLGLAMEKLFDHLHEHGGSITDAALALTGDVLAYLPTLKTAFMALGQADACGDTLDALCGRARALVTGEAAAQAPGNPPAPEAAGATVAGGTDAGSEQIARPENAAIEADTPPAGDDQAPARDIQAMHRQDTGDDAADGVDGDTDDTGTVSVAAAFSAELAELNTRLLLRLDEFSPHPTTSDLLIPMHTLYGNARFHSLDQFSRAVHNVEKFLEHFPHRLITADMAVIFRQLCDITERLVTHVADTDRIAEYPDIQEDIGKLEQLLATQGYVQLPQSPAAVNSGDNGKNADDVGDVGNVEESDGPSMTADAGFLTEARELVARMAGQLQNWQDDGDDAMAAKLRQSLVLLQGAAESAEQGAIERLAGMMVTVCDEADPVDARQDPALRASLAACHAFIDNAITRLGAGEHTDDSDTLVRELADNLLQLAGDKDGDGPESQENDDEAIDESLLAIFLDEADELLHELDTLYLRWQQDPLAESETGRAVDEYLRVLHTLKGSAALVLENDLSQAAHDYETFIIDARNTKAAFDAEFFATCDALLHDLHDIHRLYSRDDAGHIVRAEYVRRQAEPPPWGAGLVPPVPDPVPVATQTTAAIDEDGATVAAATGDGDREGAADVPAPETRDEDIAPPVTETDKAGHEARDIQAAMDEQVRVSSQLLRSLLNDADEINFSRNRIEKGLHDINTLLVDMDDTLTRLKSYVKRVEESARSSYASALEESRTAGSFDDEFDTLEMDRYTELQEMSLSLTEDYDDLQESRMNLAGRLKDIDGVLLGQQRLTHSLQGGLISSQMVPFSSVVPRLRRLARQIARELNKQVTVEVDSRQDNMDKHVLQAIVTPLEHILRNAIDHGIESPGERLQAGKPEQAQLTIKVFRAGASIHIQVSDDGRGIDVDRVKRQAINRGLLRENTRLTPDEAYQLLFQPGFSTSETVSNISGRGVGLDVVKSEIDYIGGNVEVSSKKGAGTVFTIQLPLTSSLGRVLLFDIQETRYVVLMNTLDGVLSAKLATLHQKQQQGETPTFEYGGKRYEYMYLGKFINQEFQPRPDSIDSSVTLLLVTGGDKRYALHVDAIVESRDLVVKSLGKQLAAMAGIAGGVIMPDGNVAIVLDLPSLVSAGNKGRHPAMETAMLLAGKGDKGKGARTVMVVDDSITVRKVTSSILKRNGMTVITAKNGLEAIEMLEQQVPDLILLDIEMPRMDGFEVATHIRNQPAPVCDIPIIMITSRIGDKHRNRAEEIGVNEYLCKPFQEDNLLSHIDSYQA